jgi:XTP/dITP diphosphohydrolase
MEGIPLGLPALSLAHKVVGRATRAGVPVETRSAAVHAEATPAELADLLLSVVVAAQAAGADPEQLLRQRVRDLMREVRVQEQRALADDGDTRR